MIKRNKKWAILLALTAYVTVFSTATAYAEQRTELVPMGYTVGISMTTDGALVVGLAATENGGAPSPAAQAGLLPGDLIMAVDGVKVGSAAELRALLSQHQKDDLTLDVLRGEDKLQLTLCPNTASGAVELGVWLRDSVAGIGTLTYYDPQSGKYGGLGHGINDTDSGVLMPLGCGSIFKSVITDVKRGCAGEPGELCGSFDPMDQKGEILSNTGCGIFGIFKGETPSAKAIPIAHADEIELGEAVILCNTTGCEVEEFKVEITRVYKGDNSGRSLMLCVRDERLLERTGGIVQGMSGSPIIQNGRLVGAVTHVLISNPSKGFGISIDNMLEASDWNTANEELPAA